MSQISHAISQAFTAFESGNWAEAERWSRQVLQYEGSRTDLLNLAGAACYRQGKLMEAIAWYREALALDQNQAEVYKNLGVALLDLGETDAALAQLQAAVVLAPRDPQARYNLGNAFWANQQIPEAIRLYEIALDLQPDYPAAQNNLAILLQAVGNPKQAIALYRKTLTTDPDNLAARMNLANLLQQEENYEGALVHYEKVLDIDPTYPNLAYNLALNYEGMGRTQEAIDTYYLFLQQQPNHAPSHSAIGMLLADSTRALAHLQQAITYAPDNALYYYQIGQLWSAQDALPSAIASFRQAIKLEPDFAEAHWRLGEVLFQIGQWRSGFEAYEWRWQSAEFLTKQLPRHSAIAPWQSEPLDGKRLLIWTEQGDAEAWMGLRMLPEVLSLGGTIVVECLPTQAEWFRAIQGIEVLLRGESVGDCDFQVPILSLGDRLNLETLPEMAAEIRDRFPKQNNEYES